MNKKIAFSFMVAGMVLLCLGVVAYHSTNSAVSRTLTGGSTDNALCLITAGMLSAITGAFGFNNGRSKPS